MASSALAFLYQLQGMSYQKLAGTDFKLAVIDHDAVGLSKTQLGSLQASGKAVMAYLSIGEAENYRDYWSASWNNKKPDFVLKENADWAGNFQVKFWDAGWQKILIEKAVGLAKAGYNGITLDVVDVYNLREVAAAYHGSSDVRSEMIKFVSAISDATKAINPNFKIMQNNALDLLTVNPNDPTSATNTAYLSKIDAVNAEEAFYGEDNQPVSWGKWDQQYLEHVVAAGKTVFTIDYPGSEAAQQAAIAQSIAKGFIPYVSDLGLSQIDTTNYGIFPQLAAHKLDNMMGASTATTTKTSEITYGSDNSETMNGTASVDKFYAAKGNDVVNGNEGDDFLYGNRGRDTVNGGAGNDYIEGNQDSDVIAGDAGNDTLHGGLGLDTILGGAGNDALYGETNNDLFVFTAAAGKDVIYDFAKAGKAGGDVIQIASSIYNSTAEILKHITYENGHAVIHLDGDNSVTILNIPANAFIADDFLVA